MRLHGKAKLHGKAQTGTVSALSADAGSDRTILVNEPLSLDGSASVGAFDGLQTNGQHSIQWDFGYGSWTYEGGRTAPIAYPETGTYTVTLTIYDDEGASSSDTTQITVNAITLGSEATLTDTGNAVTNMTNLQAEIDASTGTNNKVITLPAGFVAQGTLTLKHRTVANYCTIRTGNHASLPNGKTRVGPSDASNMAVIEVNTNSNIITTPTTSSSPARYYYFIGIHLRKTTSTTAYTNTFVNLGMQDETALSQLPNHIVFDRCYFDGGSTTSNTLRGILQRASDFAVVNSYFHRFKGVGIEAQAIAVMMGERSAYINNFFEAAGENWLTGGADPSISNHVPTDIVFRRNHCKKDLGWRSGDAAYYGTDMVVKNIFELKLADRASVQGNYFENHWIEDQTYAIVITVRNQEGAATWSVIKYFDFSHNIIHKIGNGMSIAAEDDLQSALPTNHVLVRHNIFRGVAFYSGQNTLFLLGGGQGGAAPVQGFDKVAIVRNSTDLNGDPTGGSGRAIEWDTSINNTNFSFLGNVMQGYIASGAGGGGVNEAAFQLACSSSSYDVRKNGFYRSKSGAMPADNSSVSLIADVKYTNLAGFDLSLAEDSPFLTTGLLGARAGADVTTVNTLTANCVSGAW